jgi:hypothetical protein
MSDNVTLNNNTTTGATLRTKARSGVETPVSILDIGGSGSTEKLIGDAGIFMPVEGAAASGAAVSGKPILVGGHFANNNDSVDDGDVANFKLDAKSNLRVVLRDHAGNDRGLNVNSDGAILVSPSNGHEEDYNTTAGGSNVDTTVCQGVVVPSASGAVAVTGTTVGSDTGLDVNIVNAAVTLAALPVGSNLIGKVDLGTTDAANLAAIKTAVEILDNTVSGSEMQVDVVGSLPAGTAVLGKVGLDTVDSGYLSSIKTAVEIIDNAISGSEMQVDIVGSLPAGSAVIGNVGLDTTDSTNLAAIKTAVQLIDNAIDGNEMQVDVVGALPTGANRIGKVQVVTSGDVAVDSFGGGTQYAEDTAVGTGGTGTLQIGIRDDSLSTLSAAEGDAVGIRATAKGALWVGVDGDVTANLGSTDTANLAAVKTAVEVIDNAISGNEMQVDIVSGDVGLTGSASTDLAAIKTAVQLIDNAISGSEMQVDVVGALPAGTAVIGKVGLDTTDSGYLSSIKTAVEIIDNAISGNEMQVDIVSGSVGITGTTQADITAIKTAVEIIDNAISGSEMQVDVVGSLPAGSNAIGKLAANSGVDIGDVDVTSISAGTNLIGDVGIQGRTTGGLTAHSKLDYVNTPVDVKSSAGTVYALTVFNMTASPFYIKMYDVAGSVNRSSHTPVLRFAVPANASSSGAGFVFNVPQGIAFSNRIQYAITTGVADTDTSGISSGNAVVNIAYK